MSVIIDEIEKKQLKSDIPSLSVGDTVVVSKLIVEGKKSRVQKFEGILIKKQNTGIRLSITVRKLVERVGVEKSFLVHSKLVPEIKVLKKGKVRRSKLYYLRDRQGKEATRIKSVDR